MSEAGVGILAARTREGRSSLECKTWIFDLYGTLLDVEGAFRDRKALFGPSWPMLAASWRSKHLELAWGGWLGGAAPDFEATANEALDAVLAFASVRDEVLISGLRAELRAPRAFEDSRPTLLRLKRLGARLALFSNAGANRLREVVCAAELDGVFDLELSASAAGLLKPAAEAYRGIEQPLGAPLQNCAFVSANIWDVRGAARAGLRAIWLNRAGRPASTTTAAWHEVPSLRELLPQNQSAVGQHEQPISSGENTRA